MAFIKSNYLLIFVFIDLIIAQQFRCPNDVPFESIIACDPEGINTCSLEHRCRPAIVVDPATPNVTSGPQQIRYLCCSSENMTIAQYFTESSISPTVVPIVPLAAVKNVVMRDEATSQLVAIDIIGSDFAPNIGVLPPNLSLSDAGSFTVLDSVAFDLPLSEGGFLHFLVAIDPLLIPSAIFLYYNYPSFGTDILNLTEANERYDRGYSNIIGSAVIPQETQYKHHFVVLVFKTLQALENVTHVDEDLAASRGDLAFLLSSTITGEALDAPILGTLFRLRTPSTIFHTTDNPINNQSHRLNNIQILGFLILVQFSFYLVL